LHSEPHFDWLTEHPATLPPTPPAEPPFPVPLVPPWPGPRISPRPAQLASAT